MVAPAENLFKKVNTHEITSFPKGRRRQDRRELQQACLQADSPRPQRQKAEKKNAIGALARLSLTCTSIKATSADTADSDTCRWRKLGNRAGTFVEAGSAPRFFMNYGVPAWLSGPLEHSRALPIGAGLVW